MAETATVYPCARLAGAIRPPGDKSISHRVGILSALAEGISTARGFLRSADCLSTLKAMEALGARAVFAGDLLRITGVGGRFHPPAQALDCGNSGTTMRLLAGLLAGQPWTSELTGDKSLSSRPMGRIREPLEQMGARVELLGPGGRAPVRITGGNLRGISYAMPMASAQVKSCVLLAGLFATGTTSVIEPLPTRDHTERMLQALGIPLEIGNNRVSLTGFGARGPAVRAGAWTVPGDFSSAAFWLAAAAARTGAQVMLREVGLNPRRTALLEVLKRMGAMVEVTPDPDCGPEPWGGIAVRGGALTGTEVGGAEIPNLIDELPLVATVGALAAGVTIIRDARELRVKESDRIACMAGNLRKMGVEVTEKEDGLVVRGGAIRGGARLESHGDHRIAMALAVLALSADAPVRINDIACVATSYPEFWDHMRSLGANVAIDRGH